MSAFIASSTRASPVARDTRSAIRMARRTVVKIQVLAGMMAALGTASTAQAAGPGFLGDWVRGDGKTHIRVGPCGAAFCGVRTWVRPGVVSGEKVGDTLVVDVRPSGAGVWSGTAFDRQQNRHYSIRIRVAERRMTTEGCEFAALMCKSMSWTRLGGSN
jgi:uncharacterized protein (DUF2147 family)